MRARNVKATGYERSEAMGRETISKLLLRFSGPAILASETAAFYNLFDAIWCGRLGAEAVAALSVAHPLMTIYRAIGGGIGVGAASLIARNLGAGKKEETNKTASCGIAFCARALGFKVRRYHMNEGHSSLLALELLRKYNMDVNRVRDLCIFTTHTPIEAGIDKFPYEVVEEIMGELVPLENLKNLGGDDRLNMTRLALNLSQYINGVAIRHRDSSREMFPGYAINAITNGIHSYTWTCESFRKLYDLYLPGWANEPGLLARTEIIPNEEIWEAHKEAKQGLINYINETTDVDMHHDTLTIGFARRATGYKRATLIFSDLEKLRKVNRKGKIQLVLAGKAHPKDLDGKRIIQEIFDHIKKLKDEIKIVYLEDYDLRLAGKLILGVDLWLNTPLPPLEASGTSGMKAAHNGVINFSVLDGWWVEGWIEDVTGWAIGPHPSKSLPDEERKIRELDDLYNKLEYVILPMFYQRRDDWIRMMKNSIGNLAYYFDSHRMMLRYVMEAYL